MYSEFAFGVPVARMAVRALKQFSLQTVKYANHFEETTSGVSSANIRRLVGWGVLEELAGELFEKPTGVRLPSPR